MNRQEQRRRLAEVLRQSIDHRLIAEYICCDPVRMDHPLCAVGELARHAVIAVLADDPEYPSEVLDKVMDELASWGVDTPAQQMLRCQRQDRPDQTDSCREDNPHGTEDAP